MFPRSLKTDIANGHIAYAETMGYPGYSKTGCAEFAYFDHIGFCQFVATVFASDVYLHTKNLMTMKQVLFSGYIFEVACAVVSLDSVLMVCLLAFPFWSEKGVRDKAMNCKSPIRSIKGQGDDWVSSTIKRVCFHKRNGRATKTPNSAQAADFVSAIIAGDWFPKFFLHESMLA